MVGRSSSLGRSPSNYNLFYGMQITAYDLALENSYQTRIRLLNIITRNLAKKHGGTITMGEGELKTKYQYQPSGDNFERRQHARQPSHAHARGRGRGRRHDDALERAEALEGQHPRKTLRAAMDAVLRPQDAAADALRRAERQLALQPEPI